MQSHRKDSSSYLNRPQTSLAVNKLPKLPSPKLKSSVAIQTDHPPHFGLPDNPSSMADIKDHYHKTLEFLNGCHEFMNSVLMGGGVRTFGDIAVHKPFDFRVPEVPNYFSVLEMFLERYKNASCPEVGMQNKGKSRRNQNWGNEEQILFDLQHFLPKNMGDGPTYVGQPQAVADCEEKNDSRNKQGKLSGRSGRSNSPSRRVKPEKGVSKNSSHQDMTSLSTTFGEILKTCNEFESKSIEYLLKNDVPLNEPLPFPKNFGLKKETFTLGHFEQGDQEPSLKRHQELLECSESLTIKDSEHSSPNKGFNLLEYALKNCKPICDEVDSPPPSPRASKLQAFGMVPNKDLLAENFSNFLVNIQAIETNNRGRPLAVLNQPHQCQSPKRVNEMFQKISREDLNCSGDTAHNDSEESEEFIRFIEYGNDSWPDNNNNCQSLEPYCDPELSSSDSIILTDEEFQRMLVDNSGSRTREKRGSGTKRNQRRKEEPKKSYLAIEAEPEMPIKSNPLKLNEKDKSLADEKVLRTIGLFTEKGDIRPGVISILEEKQRMSLTQNSAKNVKFRTERKFDLEVRFNNNNMRVTENNTSEESLGGNSILSRHNMAAVMSSACSSIGTISTCSTISESDVLNSKPIDDKALIKDFN